MRYTKSIIASTILGFMFFYSTAQDWTIEDPGKVNPNEFNQEIIDAGKNLYLNASPSCKSCHGDPGKNNPLPMEPLPPDLTSEKVQSNTDAELFYKILNGKGLMPQFKAILGEEGVWKLVSYIRSYNPDYVPADFVAEEKTSIKEGQEAVITIEIDSQQQKIKALVQLIEADKEAIPFANTEIVFFVKRYFGILEFAREKTNQEGLVRIDYPADIHGDKEGYADLIVALADDVENVQSIVDHVQIAAPTTPINIFEKRILWSENPRTQLWVLFSYGLVVIGVWLTILYVVFQVVRIARSSKS
jgi:mono/diheme cytochrome c family protein